MTMNLKNAALQKLYDTLVCGIISMSPYADSPIDKAFAECDDQLSESVTFEHIKDLQNRNDVLEKSNATLLGANLGLASTKEHLEKDLDDAKKQLKYFTLSRDDWRARAKHAEKEVEDLKKRLMETTETLEKTNADRNELRRENAAMHVLIGIKNEEISELKRVNSNLDLSIKVKRHQINVGRESRYLWDMLQNVRDVKPEEFDPECETLGDILDMDLEDFLDAYEKWQEEKDIENMRDYLERFCMGRHCYRCPLHTGKFSCGRGKWFGDMTDEELKRHYDKARDYNKRMWHGDATAKTPINDLSSWSCTMTGTVEINKDLLNKVCGIDSDD